MKNQLKDWKGKIFIDGEQVSVDDIKPEDEISISLVPYQKEYKVTVRQYMTQKSTDDFDFMKKWNNDIPMPMTTMVGSIESEMRGMVYMNLHSGDIKWQGWVIKSAILEMNEVR